MVMRMMDKKASHVDVLILNFNGKSLLKQCLESVGKTDYSDFKTFVIDNGSTDGSIEFVRKSYPWVKLVEIGRNLGVAEAYNQVIEGLSSEFVAILNNDVEVDEGWLKHLMEVIEGGDDNIAGATSKIKFLNDRGIINSAGGSCDIYGIGWNRGNGEFDNGQYDKIDEPFYLTGTTMVIKKHLWEKAGRFDERYFLYGEDLDWSWRARMRGYKLNYVPTSIVYHKWQSSRRIAPVVYLLERNWLCTILKNYSLKTLISIMPRYLMLKTLKTLWMLMRGRKKRKTGDSQSIYLEYSQPEKKFTEKKGNSIH